MSDIFFCSFCEQKLKISSEQIGRLSRCPKCKEAIWVYPNGSAYIAEHLTTQWLYRKERLFRTPEVQGPMLDEEFLQLLEEGAIAPDAEVRLVSSQDEDWILAGKVSRQNLKTRIRQRSAELGRLKRIQERAHARDRANREKLLRAVELAVADGRVSLKERGQINNFGKAIGMAEAEIEELLRLESQKLFNTVLNECIADGLLEPTEKAKLSELAIGLGVNFRPDREQKEKLELADLAFSLLSGEVPPFSGTASLQLTKGEEVIACAKAEWSEITQSERSSDVSLGNGHFLKHIASGECYLTNKRIVLVGEMNSKKMTLSSIEAMQWYSDGVFCNRSTGKSVFLSPVRRSNLWNKFAMTMIYVKTNEPVLGIVPQTSFIPVAVEKEIVEAEYAVPSDYFAEQPRYTFRVVGEFVGDRQKRAAGLSFSDRLILQREPGNPHDQNAVRVLDSAGGDLGYLKKEVASWFSGIMDSGRKMEFKVAGWTQGGSLLVAVFLD